MEDQNGWDLAFKAGMQSAPVKAVSQNGIPFVVIPDGCKIETLEKVGSNPPFKKASVACNRVEDFCRYVNDHKTPTTAIFCFGNCFTAELDYHAIGSGLPSFRLHKAMLNLAFSKEFTAWSEIDDKYRSQEEFAEFLEERCLDVTNPPGGALFDLITNLSGISTVEWGKSIKLPSGEMQLNYKETNGVQGDIAMPTSLTLNIPIFQKGQYHQMDVRLRHRIKDGKITFRTTIKDRVETVEDAFNAIREQIQTATTINPLGAIVT